MEERNSHVFRRGFVWFGGALSAVLLAYVLFLLRHVLIIIAFAGFWASFLAGPVHWIRRWIPRRAAIYLVFFTAFLLLLGVLGPIGSVLFHQMNELIRTIPSLASKLEGSIQGLRLEIVPGQSISLAESWNSALEQLRQEAPALLGHAFDVSQTFLTNTLEVLIALVLIPVISLYLLLDSAVLRATFIGVFPNRMHEDVDQVLSAIGRSLGNYIYSRILMALFVGVGLLTFLMILRVPFSLVLALLAFMAEFIPVIGAWIAIVPAVLIALAATGPVPAIWLLVLFVLLQLAKDYFVAPRLLSETMDIHPLTVVLAMLIGGTLGGFAGLLLAIPAVAAIKVILNVFVFRRAEKGVHLPGLEPLGNEIVASPMEPPLP